VVSRISHVHTGRVRRWYRRAISPIFTFTALLVAVVGQLTPGCTATPKVLPANATVLREGVSSDTGLVFGRVQVEGWKKALLAEPETEVEFRNAKTGRRIFQTLEKAGEYFLVFPIGDYTITAVWSGFQSIQARTERGPIAFTVPPGRVLYLGTLRIRFPAPDRPGEVALLDEFETATQSLTARFPTLRLANPPLKWLSYPSAGGETPGRIAVPPAGTVIPIQIVNNLILVPATLNHTQRATLILDTGATRSLLTPAMATRLGISPPADAPRRSVHLVGGQKIDVPFANLSALQVGDAVVENLEVGIHLVQPGALIVDGLLGGDFLGRFKMIVDRSARQLQFESRPTTE
jgi:aspartyl protease